MYPKRSSAPKNGGAKPARNNPSGVAAAFQYTPPVYRQTDGCDYIEFYAYDPEQGKLRRKRIKTNRIKGLVKRRDFVRDTIKRLTDQLQHGWNPWIAQEVGDLYIFEDVADRYEAHVEKMYAGGYYRKETYVGYKSFIKMLRMFIEKHNRIYYVYQFNRKFCMSFLDYVFIERNNSAQTRNNYLNNLRVFSSFLLEKGYVEARPTDGILPISKRLIQKERECIPMNKVAAMADYCKARDPHFLLACYILYYTFVRPVEMTRLRVENFNLRAGTLTIPAGASKNHRTQTVTVPKKVIHYAVELGIFSAPATDFIFSDRLKPGPAQIDPKIFRDHWEKLRRAIGLPKECKFYSLKDTGITAMLKAKLPAISVRDQARHSSLAITEIYTDHSAEVNPTILNLDGAL